jgi:hypothetical protein
MPTAPSPVAGAPQDTIDYQAVVEALFLGTGPLARIDNPGCDPAQQRMRGWPLGSRVQIVAYASLDAVTRGEVQQALPQVNAVFGTRVTVSYQTRDDAEEPLGFPDNEIAVLGAEQARAVELCGSLNNNCHIGRSSAPGIYRSSRVILFKPFKSSSLGVISHELGHAFGLCHLDPSRGGYGPAISNMSSAAVSLWTVIDIEAIRRVHHAGLVPGDDRQRFVTAELIR